MLCPLYLKALSPLGKEERGKECLFIEWPLFATLEWAGLSLSYINSLNLDDNLQNQRSPLC